MIRICAAAVLLVLSGQVPAFAAPKEYEPPPLPANAQLPPRGTEGAPAPDVPYVSNGQQCIGSSAKGKTVEDIPYGQLRLNLEQAHRFATGKGVKVAVIDTGVVEHPLLKGRVAGGGDFVERSNGKVDCDGHGTEVAGVLASSEDASGFVGAAPEAEILSIRHTSDRFEFKGTASEPARPRAGNLSTLAKAIVHAARSGAEVINISVTNCVAPQEFSANDQMLQAAIRFAVDKEDVVIVTAAGNLGPTGCPDQNDNPDPRDVKVVASPPLFADDVLSVASIGENGTVSQFSVWGPWVSIAGPGEGIVTLDPGGPGLVNAGISPEAKEQQPIVGTSFASPYVAGVAALVRERFPALTARQVMARLKATAQHPGNTDGRDHKVGHGMVNPVAALTAVIPAERPGATPPRITPIHTVVNPPAERNWRSLGFALGGAGTGFALLLFTLFVVHAVRRSRAQA
ncbi:type VII secretion-associated serine protease mycosin [Lentzea tibetensis]|uniref:type VII secretion-associated serine protease mycosin n=1 Tax=Lentzea tibetensis TaxID=2591470 RepID=UPI0016468413|nr:type VII secretion-associated serine protease mycosin [Lentzea tibetensis]